MGHVKTIWRAPLKNKNGHVSVSGLFAMIMNLDRTCIKTCKDALSEKSICLSCHWTKVRDYLLKLSLRQRAKDAPQNCICEYGTCDIMQLGKCYKNLSVEDYQKIEEASKHKVETA
jgi:hypothetical protein